MSDKIKAISIYGNDVEVEKSKFRIRVSGYALILHENKILLVKTKSTNKFYFPGGEVEIGENIEEAIKREVLEEANMEVNVEKFITFREVFFFCDPSNEAFQNYSMFFLCKPITFEITDKFNLQEDESCKPEWIELDKLKENDLQKGCFEIINLIK